MEILVAVWLRSEGPFCIEITDRPILISAESQGTSVIMYRSAELRRYQYYVHANWSGGVYASPSIAGSRPGSLIAGAWATMHYMGSAYIYLSAFNSCRAIPYTT
jgi:hypothetical protein